MTLLKSRLAAWIPLCVVAGLAACADSDVAEPTAPATSRTITRPQLDDRPIERFPEMRESIPAVRIAASGVARRADLDDAALIDAVSRAKGRVLIGLKPDEAPRTSETGVVPAITRATALRGRSAIEALGAEITRTFRHSSAVAATIPPHVAPPLRRLGVVDYVEPSFPGIVTQASPPQDTS